MGRDGRSVVSDAHGWYFLARMPKGHFHRNTHRRKPQSKSGMKGVYYVEHVNGKPISTPWKAYIRKHGQYICLGYYKTQREAAIAYNKAVLKMFGPDSYFNHISCMS